MDNLPQSSFEEDSSSGIGAVSTTIGPGGHEDPIRVHVKRLICALNDDRTRENALRLLSMNIRICEDLAILLWYSFGSIYALLKEIVAVYSLLSTPNLTRSATVRICNALALLQCVASHPETKIPFIKANVPLYLIPFLDTVNKDKPHEFLRISSLCVIGGLVKENDEQVIDFLLKAKIFPKCLLCMDVGDVLSKTVATYTLDKILLNDEGLKYCCSFAQRFYTTCRVLEKMVDERVDQSLQKLLKYIVHCYLRLSENPRARSALRGCLPKRFTEDATFAVLTNDLIARGWLDQLLHNVFNGALTT